MANEPVYVDGGDLPAKKEICYHFGLDIGGSEGLVDVVSATEGIVTQSGNEVLAGQAAGVAGERRAEARHVYDKPGTYLVSVEHVSAQGFRAVARLIVRVSIE